MPIVPSGAPATAAHAWTHTRTPARVHGLLDALLLAASQVVDTARPVPTVPHTPLGRTLQTLLVTLRYALVLVPTGIVAAEIQRRRAATRGCPACATRGHAAWARFCWHCGERLPQRAGARA